MDNFKADKLILPGAIIIAGLIIAGAIFYREKTPSPTQGNEPNKERPGGAAASPLDNIKPISGEDHVLGNPEAAATLILFTDLECPFCKRFHLTMKQIMEEYGKAGKVKWVLRHFPLEQLHSKAKNEAIAAECAADLGGNEKFWQYVDRLFEITPGNNGLDPGELPKIAEYVGLNKNQFIACLSSGKFNQHIAESIKDAMNSGALGTPYGVLIGPNGQKSVIAGALSYSETKEKIDEMLK